MTHRTLLAAASGVAVVGLALMGVGTIPAQAADPGPASGTPVYDAAPDQAKHPSADSLWADSSADTHEPGINGTVAALVDSDPATPGQDTTFWITDWSAHAAYPHALAFDNAGFDKVCGITYTSRPTYGSGNTATTGAKDSPASYKILSLIHI